MPTIVSIWPAMASHNMAWGHVIFACLPCAPRIASPRHAAGARERGSAGARERTLDRQDRGDDDGDDDDYKDKLIMVDDGLPRYTGLTAKQRRMLL